MDEKRKLLGNFEKILKKSLKKIAKNALFEHIYQKISIEKLNIFSLIFVRKFVTKNRALVNNTSFLQQFFRFPRIRPWPILICEIALCMA